MELLLDVFEQRGHIAHEIIARHDRRIELAVLAIEPVAADHRDVAAGNIAPAALDDHRRALLDPAPALDRVHGVLVLLQRLQVGRSEEHTSELQSLMTISYAVFCLKKKTIDLHSQ